MSQSPEGPYAGTFEHHFTIINQYNTRVAMAAAYGDTTLRPIMPAYVSTAVSFRSDADGKPDDLAYLVVTDGKRKALQRAVPIGRYSPIVSDEGLVVYPDLVPPECEELVRAEAMDEDSEGWPTVKKLEIDYQSPVPELDIPALHTRHHEELKDTDFQKEALRAANVLAGKHGELPLYVDSATRYHLTLTYDRSTKTIPHGWIGLAIRDGYRERGTNDYRRRSKVVHVLIGQFLGGVCLLNDSIGDTALPQDQSDIVLELASELINAKCKEPRLDTLALRFRSQRSDL